jgi:hypothetical protein
LHDEDKLEGRPVGENLGHPKDRLNAFYYQGRLSIGTGYPGASGKCAPVETDYSDLALYQNSSNIKTMVSQ